MGLKPTVIFRRNGEMLLDDGCRNGMELVPRGRSKTGREPAALNETEFARRQNLCSGVNARHLAPLRRAPTHPKSLDSRPPRTNIRQLLLGSRWTVLAY